MTAPTPADNGPSFPPTAEFGAETPSMVVEHCACALCQPKTDDDIRARHADLSDEERQDLIRGLGEDAELYKSIAAISDDPAYWCALAYKAQQERNALMAGRT